MLDAMGPAPAVLASDGVREDAYAKSKQGVATGHNLCLDRPPTFNMCWPYIMVPKRIEGVPAT